MGHKNSYVPLNFLSYIVDKSSEVYYEFVNMFRFNTLRVVVLIFVLFNSIITVCSACSNSFLECYLLLSSDTSQKDTTNVKTHSPSKAALYSTFLPGLGQAYNQKYWKIPIVYVVIGSIGYFAYSNHKEYTIFRDALRARYDDNPNTTDNFPNINDQVLKAQREFYRRNRDLFLILSVIAYGMNILDAYVDAHLKGFSVSDKLTILPLPAFNGIQVGLNWKLP